MKNRFVKITIYALLALGLHLIMSSAWTEEYSNKKYGVKINGPDGWKLDTDFQEYPAGDIKKITLAGFSKKLDKGLAIISIEIHEFPQGHSDLKLSLKEFAELSVKRSEQKTKIINAIEDTEIDGKKGIRYVIERTSNNPSIPKVYKFFIALFWLNEREFLEFQARTYPTEYFDTYLPAFEETLNSINFK
jgi:hypothetical protein